LPWQIRIRIKLSLRLRLKGRIEGTKGSSGNLDWPSKKVTLTPGTPVTPVASTSKKRPAQDDAETPKRPSKVTRISPRRSMFTKVVKHNIKDKKQLQFDLRFARYMVGTNLSMAHAANIETLEFFEEFLPIYHIKNPSTFTRYYSGLFVLLRIQHNITEHICFIAITT